MAPRILGKLDLPGGVADDAKCIQKTGGGRQIDRWGQKTQTRQLISRLRF